jgi:DNA-binding transcriptional LysR family regulator
MSISITVITSGYTFRMSIPRLDSMIARMRLRQLALVAAIDEYGSVNAAAPLVHVTQPAATKMLHEIEEQLGGPLFVREPRGMVPTPLGRAVALFGRQVVGDLSRLRDEAVGLASGARGSIVVGCTTAAISSVLTPAIASLELSSPSATVKVMVDSSDMLLPQVLAGRVDLMLGRVYSAQAGLFHFEALASDSLRIVSGPVRRARPKIRSLQALAERSWILPPVGNLLRSTVDAAFRASDLSPPRVTVETSSTIVTLSLLATTEMISVLPSRMAQDYRSHGVVSIIETESDLELGPFGLVWREGRILSPLVKAFCMHVRASVRAG